MQARGFSKINLAVVLFILCVFALVALRILAINYGKGSLSTESTTQTVSTSQPATKPIDPVAVIEPRKIPFDLLDVIRDRNPKYPTSQPLDFPIDLKDADRIILSDPCYLDPRGDLWITHDNAPTADEVIRTLALQRVHIVREEILFVQWLFDLRNKPTPVIVYRDAMNAIKVLSRNGTQSFELSRHFNWDKAFTWNDQIILPSDRGFSVITFLPEIKENFIEIIKPDMDLNNINSPVVVFESNSLLMFSPWDNNKQGSDTVLRYDGKNCDILAQADKRPLHIVPLLDGALLQIGLDEHHSIELKTIESGVPIAIDEKKINALVTQMADPDPLVRAQATDSLTQFGPSIWPFLQKIKDDQPLEAQTRIDVLLAQRLAPSLGGNTPLEGHVKTISRSRDGGVVFFLNNGVKYNQADDPQTDIPAWISIQPGRTIQRLDRNLTSALNIEKDRITARGLDWLVFNPSFGTKRWIGNRWETLLQKSLSEFDTFTGIDAGNRWIFKSTSHDHLTLIIDPTLPDITPRLPIWKLVTQQDAGWTNTDWPAIKRNDKVFVATDTGWRMMDQSEKFITESPTTTSLSATTPDGDIYTITETNLTQKSKAGNTQSWPLPQAITGDPKLVLTNEQHIFVVNSAGVHRIQITGKSLEVQSTFAADLMNDATRVWSDPSGRLIISHKNELHIAYPSGFIPPVIQKLIVENPTKDQ